MKRLTLALLCVFLVGCSAPIAGNPVTVDNATDVRAAFEMFKKATVAKDGSTALRVVASPTVEYYDLVRMWALSGSMDQVRRLPAGQRVAVYTVRAEIDPSVLRQGSAQDLLKSSIDKGIVSELGIKNLGLGEVTVLGDLASAEARVEGGRTPFTVEFIREGVWKVDFAPLLRLADRAIPEAAQHQGMSLDDVIDRMLAAKYGKEKAAELSKPLG